MTEWLHWTALILYALAATLLGVSFARDDQRLPRLAQLALGGALLAHGWSIASFTSQWNELPLVGLGPVLTTLAFLIGLGTLMAATLGHAGTVGLVLAPVIAVLMLVAGLVGVEPTGEAVAFQGPWFALHVIFAAVGYVGLTVAFAAGLMYLLQFRQLKGKNFGAIFRFFPPLDTLDRLGQKGLLVGFPFLTLALVLGWGWTMRFQGAAPAGSKLAWVILSWVVFLVALVSRLGGGRRGHRSALASVIGFVMIVLLYLVLRVQLPHGGTFL